MSFADLFLSRPWSLRRRLLLICFVGTLTASVVGGALMYFVASDSNERLHDQQMSDLAHTILRFAQHELTEIALDPTLSEADRTVHRETEFNLDSRYSYQIYTREGKLLLRSYNAPADHMIAPRGQLGYGHAEIDDREFCTYVYQSRDTGMQIHLSAPEDERAISLADLGSGMMLVFVVMFALLVVFTAVAVWMATRPITEAARQLVSRSPSDLQPLNIPNAPAELVPMTGAVNELFGRIDAAMTREREFTAVAAHEMRTPLASLRVLAQVARRARNDTERNEALHDMLHSVDRCSHLIDQLLTLARVDSPGAAAVPTEQVDLPRVVDEVIHDLSHEARSRDIQIASQVQSLSLVGQRFGVQTLLSNLLGNAIRYTPAGGRVAIDAHADAASITVTIDDSGRGIPQADRQRVFDRFRRLQHDNTGGVGLGLSIVQSVAQAHRAMVNLLDSPLGGLRVQVTFPVAS